MNDERRQVLTEPHEQASLDPDPHRRRRPLSTADTPSMTREENSPNSLIYGNPDDWELICKASCDVQGWMRSTKAYEILGAGCLVQVSTIDNGQIAEAVTFVPGVVIERIFEEFTTINDDGEEETTRFVSQRHLTPG